MIFRMILMMNNTITTIQQTSNNRIVHLLNSLPHTNAQHFKIFVQALQYAQATKQTDHVLKYAANIEDMLNEWNASVTDKRSVYLVFYDILSEQRYENFKMDFF